MRVQQSFQLFFELTHILEVSINRGETNVGHRVETLQVLHDQLADLARSALALWRIHEIALRSVHYPFQLAGRNRTLLARAQQAAQNLLPVEALAASIFLHHHVRNFVDALVSGEAAIAALALAPAADRVRLLALARIDNPVLCEATVRTLHAVWILADGCRDRGLRDVGTEGLRDVGTEGLDGDKQRSAGYSRGRVHRIEKCSRNRRHILDMPKYFSILPRNLPRLRNAPRRYQVLESGYIWKRVAGQPHIQRLLRGIDDAVQRGVERGVVVVLRRSMLRH